MVDKVPVPAGIAVLCPSIVARGATLRPMAPRGPSNRQPVTRTLRFLYKESIRQAGKRLASTLGDIATDTVTRQMSTVQATLARTSNQGVQLLHADNPAEAFANAPLMLQGATPNALCVVKLHRARRGPTRFHAQSVEICWRGGSPEAPAPAKVRVPEQP